MLGATTAQNAFKMFLWIINSSSEDISEIITALVGKPTEKKEKKSCLFLVSSTKNNENKNATWWESSLNGFLILELSAREEANTSIVWIKILFYLWLVVDTEALICLKPDPSGCV